MTLQRKLKSYSGSEATKLSIKVLVCGGRDFKDWNLLHDTLSELHNSVGFSHIIHGNARGADTLAGAFAQTYLIQEVICPANWNRGKSAGVFRNTAMLGLNPDLVVAFPGGNGTANMVKQAREAGVEVMEVMQNKSVERDTLESTNNPGTESGAASGENTQ